MNFDFNNLYIEYESDEIPYSWYEINGVRKIKELSRQLRTFLNYKTATILYRFRSKSITLTNIQNKKFIETKRNFINLTSELLKLIQIIKGKGISFDVEIKNLLDRIVIMEDEADKSLFVKLKDITQKYFTNIHILSEQEINLHPRLLKFVVKLTQEACTVFKIINNWASEFYEELRVNYFQLHNELILLIPEEKAEKSNIRKKQFLEEGLREW